MVPVVKRDKYIFIPARNVPLTHADLLTKLAKVIEDDWKAEELREETALKKLTTDLDSKRITDGTVPKDTVHPILHTYEKAHLKAGGDWPAARQKIRDLNQTLPKGTFILVQDAVLHMDTVAPPPPKKVIPGYSAMDPGYTSATFGANRGDLEKNLTPFLKKAQSEKKLKPVDLHEGQLMKGTRGLEGRSNQTGMALIEAVVGQTDDADGVVAKLGTVFIGDARFTRLHPQPTGLPGKVVVYVPGRIQWVKTGPDTESVSIVSDPNHSKSHFVWLPKSKTFVRRFVTRGLNHNDIVNIAANQPLGAPIQTFYVTPAETTSTKPGRFPATTPTTRPLTIQQQILSHTRGWQKRFISTGVSNAPVFSTLGTQFVSLYGTALIDLAKLDPDNVYDIHSTDAVHNLLGWNATKVLSQAQPGHKGAKSLASEEFLALRDVLRTRELLIHKEVPLAALVCDNKGQLIVGIGVNSLGEVAKALQEQQAWTGGWKEVMQSDSIKYKGAFGYYWLFMLFRDALVAKWFYDQNVSYYGTSSKRTCRLFTRYEMPASLDGWKL